jgi:hypothetical protein
MASQGLEGSVEQRARYSVPVALCVPAPPQPQRLAVQETWMRRQLLLLVGFALNGPVAFAQHLDQEPIASTPPPSAVYEIVQTSRAMKDEGWPIGVRL